MPSHGGTYPVIARRSAGMRTGLFHDTFETKNGSLNIKTIRIKKHVTCFGFSCYSDIGVAIDDQIYHPYLCEQLALEKADRLASDVLTSKPGSKIHFPMKYDFLEAREGSGNDN
jgi:hypothetical protein